MLLTFCLQENRDRRASILENLPRKLSTIIVKNTFPFRLAVAGKNWRKAAFPAKSGAFNTMPLSNDHRYFGRSVTMVRIVFVEGILYPQCCVDMDLVFYKPFADLQLACNCEIWRHRVQTWIVVF